MEFLPLAARSSTVEAATQPSPRGGTRVSGRVGAEKAKGGGWRTAGVWVTGGHGTALGPARHRLAVAAAPELLGSGGAAAGPRGRGTRRLGRHGDERSLRDRRGAADQPRSVAAAGIRAAHRAAHGCGTRRLAGLQSRLCGTWCQKPPSGKNPDPRARHPAIGADPRLSVDHRDRVHGPLSGPIARRRMRRNLRDFYLASLEHDLQRLPVAAHGADGADRGRADVPPLAVAAVLAARSAARDPVARLEHDDVGLGWLVLRGRLGGDHRGRTIDPATRCRLLYRHRDYATRPRGDRLGRSRHVRRNPVVRSAAVSPTHRLVAQVSGRAVARYRQYSTVVSDRPATGAPVRLGSDGC